MTPTSWPECFTYGTDNRCDAMSLTKPNQELRRNLKNAAAFLEDAAQALFAKAKKLPDAEFLSEMERIGKLNECIDTLQARAEEVKAGRINRHAEQRK